MKHTVRENALVGERNNFINSRSAQTSRGLSSLRDLFPINAVTRVVAGHTKRGVNLSFLWVR